MQLITINHHCFISAVRQQDMCLKQCWFIMKGVLWHSSECNFTRCAHEFNQWHVFGDDIKLLPHFTGANVSSDTNELFAYYQGYGIICLTVDVLFCTVQSGGVWQGSNLPTVFAQTNSHCACFCVMSVRVVAENTRQTWASGLDDGNCSVAID